MAILSLGFEVSILPTTVDAATMRLINRFSVFNVLYDTGIISRIEIANRTGLNKATVSSLIDDFIAGQFVHEVGFGESSGGRKPILLKFNAKAAYCIGIDIQVTHIKTVLTDISGALEYKKVRTVDLRNRQIDETALIGVLVEEIESAIAAAPSSPHGIIGVGIACPGIVNFNTGDVYYLPNIGIEDWPLRAELQKHVKIPIFIDNDGNCGAWALHLAERLQNIVYVNAGIGIGTGIIINGQLYRGHTGIAGELGHTTISAIGILCKCGNYGCWEQYASEQALLRYLQEDGEVAQNEQLDAEFVSRAVQKAVNHHPTYEKAFQSIGMYLGIGIANILNTLNPEQVILGGTIAQGAEMILPEVKTAIRHRAMASNKQTDIQFASEDIVAVGSAGIALWQTLMKSPIPT